MTFDAQVQTVTQDKIVPKVTDQTLQSNAITLALLANGRPWAGETLKFPIKVSNHTQGGSFDDFQTFDTANEKVRQNTSFDPRGYYQSVTIGGFARMVNGVSKTQLLNLVKVEMESCHQDMSDDVADLVYGDGTGNSSKDFLGLDAGIDDASNVPTYGNLSGSTYSAWKSAIQTSVGAFDFSKARTLMNSATLGSQKPTILVTTETVYGYVEADYTQTVQGNYAVLESNRATLTGKGVLPAQRSGLTGYMGFTGLYYDGTPIIKDDKCDSGKMYAINTNFYHWYGLTNFDVVDATAIDLKSAYHDGNDYDGAQSSYGFGWTGFQRPYNQLAFIGQILLMGNLITNARRLHSSSAGITS